MGGIARLQRKFDSSREIMIYTYDADHPPDSGIPGFPRKPSKNSFCQFFWRRQETLEKPSRAFEKSRKTVKKRSAEGFLRVFRRFRGRKNIKRGARASRAPP